MIHLLAKQIQKDYFREKLRLSLDGEMDFPRDKSVPYFRRERSVPQVNFQVQQSGFPFFLFKETCSSDFKRTFDKKSRIVQFFISIYISGPMCVLLHQIYYLRKGYQWASF